MPFIRRAPLLRMAAVGGVAYMGARAGTNRAIAQQEAAAQQEQQAPPPQPPAATPAQASGNAGERISQLKELADLKAAGALTEEEFEREKAKILA